MKNDYDLLFKQLVSFDEDKWYLQIRDILARSPLKLPVEFKNEYPYETLIFLDDFLRRRDSSYADVFSKELVDYYTTLSPYDYNVEKFKILHQVFAKVKPIGYRYALEKKFTKEDFLLKYPEPIGEYLQINLLATLSNLSCVDNETISSYLFNKANIYTDNEFIRVSLRYFMKSVSPARYKKYLDYLIDLKLDENNGKYFVEAYKEMVFISKSYKGLYDWVSGHFDQVVKQGYLRDAMVQWINYEHVDMNKEEYKYMNRIFFMINKNDLLPCRTIVEMLEQIQVILTESSLHKEEIAVEDKYLISSLINHFKQISSQYTLDTLSFFNKKVPYRKGLNVIHIDGQRIGETVMKDFAAKYKVDLEEMYRYSADEEMHELLDLLTRKQGHALLVAENKMMYEAE